MAVSSSIYEDNMTQLWMMSGFFLLAFFFVLMVANQLDTRTLANSPIWAKPIKFSLSLAMHFFTLAILVRQIPIEQRSKTVLVVFGYLAVASMLLEQIYISLQAARGRPSHFNFETATEASMYSLMGVGAVLLVIISFTVGVMIWKYGKTNSAHNANKELTGLRWGSILGLIIGSILTLVVAGYMSSGKSHLIGPITHTANPVPLLGWSRTVGDLRISHFVATHMMQILPIIGLIGDGLKIKAKYLVLTSALLLTAICLGLFFMALSGQPIFPG